MLYHTTKQHLYIIMYTYNKTEHVSLSMCLFMNHWRNNSKTSPLFKSRIAAWIVWQKNVHKYYGFTKTLKNIIIISKQYWCEINTFLNIPDTLDSFDVGVHSEKPNSGEGEARYSCQRERPSKLTNVSLFGLPIFLNLMHSSQNYNQDSFNHFLIIHADETRIFSLYDISILQPLQVATWATRTYRNADSSI